MGIRLVDATKFPVIFLLTASIAIAAQRGFLEDRGRGWFWYERVQTPPEPEEVEGRVERAQPQAVQTQPQAVQAPRTFSVEWFKQHYERLLVEAIDNPTPENVDTYRVATRVMLDKASNVAQVFRERLALDQDLDEFARYPAGTALRQHGEFLRSANVDAVMKYLSDKVGLWVFLDEECHYCEIQAGIAKELASKHGFYVSYIVKQGRPFGVLTEKDEVLPDLGHAQMLNLMMTPAVVMVDPANNKFVVLSQGMLARDQLEERILLAAKNEGIIDNYQYASVNPNVAGLLTPAQISGLGDLGSKNFASEVRKALRENIDYLNATRKKLASLSG